MQAAAGAYRYLLQHLRPQDAALLARELVVQPVVRSRPGLGFVLACWGPCGGALVPCVRGELWPLCCDAAPGSGHGACNGVTVEVDMP